MLHTTQQHIEVRLYYSMDDGTFLVSKKAYLKEVRYPLPVYFKIC